MTSIYMGKNGQNLVGNSMHAYGNTEFEATRVNGNGLIVDQNFERVEFSGNASDYLFTQHGNQLLVSSGSTLVATITVHEAGTQLTFANGSANAILTGASMSLGNKAISTTTAGALSPTLDTSVTYANTLAGASETKAGLYLTANDSQMLMSHANVYGSSGNEIVLIAAGANNVQVDQNIERVDLPVASSVYQFKQSGNQIDVMAGTTLVGKIAIPEAGLKMAFINGSTSVVYGAAGILQMGGKALSSTAQTLAPALTASEVSACPVSSGSRGTVVDGYVKDAIVFEDLDGDGQRGLNEPAAMTDANGNFVITNGLGIGKIIASGGTDIMTGKPFQGVLTAPAGSTVVNPITTLAESLVAQGRSIIDAQSAVQTALHLPANINPLSYDPLAVLGDSNASSAAKAAALGVQASALQVANIITQISAALDAGGATTAGAQHGVLSALATLIGGATTNIDLANTNTITQLVQNAATTAGTPTVNAAVAGQLAQITSACNTAAASATTITALAQAATVAQGDATAAIASAFTSGGSGSLTSAIASFTGSALTTAIGSATTGQIVPGVVVPPPVVVPPVVVPPPASGGGSSDPVPPAPTFAVHVNSETGGVTFDGTGEIVLDSWDDSGVMTFRQGDDTDTAEYPDDGFITVGSGQTLVADAADVDGLSISGAGAVRILNLELAASF